MSTALAEALRLGYSFAPEQLSYHECGHAIVADALGRSVRRLTLDPPEMVSDGPGGPRELLLLSIAGVRAERLAPLFLSTLIDTGCTVDERDVERALKVLAWEPVQRAWILEDATRQVDLVLAERRNALGRLARQLLDKRHLDGRDVRRILG